MSAMPGLRRTHEPWPASIHASTRLRRSTSRFSGERVFNSASNRSSTVCGTLSARWKVTCCVTSELSKCGRYPRLCHLGASFSCLGTPFSGMASFGPPIGRLAFPGLVLELSTECLVQQRFFQCVQRSELLLVDGFETLGFGFQCVKHSRG